MLCIRGTPSDPGRVRNPPSLAHRPLRRTLRTMAGDPLTPAPAGSRVALAVLVALVVLSPWPFGSVHLRTTQAIALVSLATALGAFLWDGWRGQLQLPPRALLWPLLGLWALAVFQLIPLPEGLHHWIAPGSAAVWHPDVPAAAAVLGPGPHPISLYPEATRRWLAFATGVVALALAAAPALRDRHLLLRASIAIVAGAVLVAVYGFVARLVFGDKLFGAWTVPTVAPFGPFVSKNHFAGYVELAALLAVGLATGLADEARRGEGWLSWIESRRAKWVVVAWGAALVLVLAVPVSLSRGGVVSLTAGLACFVLLRALGPQGLTALGPAASSASLAGLGAAGLLLVAVLPHGGARPRPHPRRHHERPVRLLPPGPLAGHPAPRRLEPRGRLRLRRLRGRAAPLQDRGRRLPRPARRERPPGAPGRRRTPRRPAGRGGRPGAPAPRPEGPPRHGAPPRPVSPRRRARRRSRGLRPRRLRLQPPHPVERADGGAPRGGLRLGRSSRELSPRRRRRARPPIRRRAAFVAGRLPPRRPRHPLERAALGPGHPGACHSPGAHRPPTVGPRERRDRVPAAAPRPSGGLGPPRLAAAPGLSRRRIGPRALGGGPRSPARGAGAVSAPMLEPGR